jgi:hypothetical protein
MNTKLITELRGSHIAQTCDCWLCDLHARAANEIEMLESEIAALLKIIQETTRVNTQGNGEGAGSG